MSQPFDQLAQFAARGLAAQAAADAAIAAAPKSAATRFRVKVQYPHDVIAYACAILLPDGRLPRVGESTGGRGRIRDVYQVEDNSAEPAPPAYKAPRKVL